MSDTAIYKKIAVIKLGALGDVFLAMRSFAAIRQHHPEAHITIITTSAFAGLCGASPYFDDTLIVARWRITEIFKWVTFRRTLRRHAFDLVYDLQRNDRTRIMQLIAPATARRNWVRARQPETLKPGTIDPAGAAPSLENFSWLKEKGRALDLPAPFALLVPGSAPQHPRKRWPATHYSTLAHSLLQQGITPVVLGTAAEAETTSEIKKLCPDVIDLTGQTKLEDIAALADRAVCGIGNDTGPMHLVSLCGCPVVSLFSGASDPKKSAPQGSVVETLRAEPISGISPDDVLAAFDRIRRR